MTRSSTAQLTLTGLRATALALAACLALAAGCSGGDTPLNNNNNAVSDRCPAGYLLVPKGTFTMGVNPEDLAGTNATYLSGSGPAHTVTLTADFCMGKTEITVAEYRQCRASGACTGEGPWPLPSMQGCNYHDTDTSRDSHPVNCLTYEDAREYCQAQGGDLPTEAQWIRAAQGEDRRFFAWGNSDPDCSRANFDVNGPGSDGAANGYGCDSNLSPPYTRPVGSAPAGASPYGLLDMTGNVAEYVLGCYYFFSACDGELGCVDSPPIDCNESNPYHIALGGCFSNGKWGLYSFDRGPQFDDRVAAVGMRCVLPTLNAR